MGSISIIVAEGDPVSLKRTVECVKTMEGVSVVLATVDGEALINDLRRDKPDIVVLDLFLRRVDGFGVLEAIQRIEGLRPKVLIYTSLYTDFWMQRALALGASYYMLKPANLGQLCSRIKQLIDEREMERKREESIDASVVTNSRLRLYITGILMKLGFPSHLKGYHYLAESVIMAYRSGEAMANMSKCIFPEIACKYKTSVACVEHSIRTSINVAWRSGGFAYYVTEYESRVFAKEKPTVGCMIALTLEALRALISEASGESFTYDHKSYAAQYALPESAEGASYSEIQGEAHYAPHANYGASRSALCAENTEPYPCA